MVKQTKKNVTLVAMLNANSLAATETPIKRFSLAATETPVKRFSLAATEGVLRK